VHVIMNGAELKRLREEQGLSKKALAKAANVTQATASRAERSRRVYPATAELIGEALGVDQRTLGQRS
jgi:transcriptional regulator with XRE-family HTH domain